MRTWPTWFLVLLTFLVVLAILWFLGVQITAN